MIYKIVAINDIFCFLNNNKELNEKYSKDVEKTRREVRNMVDDESGNPLVACIAEPFFRRFRPSVRTRCLQSAFAL